MPSQHRWRVRALVLVMLYFTFIGGTFLTDQRLWPRIIHHVLITGGLLIWLMPSVWGGRVLPTTPIDLPLVALFAAYVLATVFAVDPRVSLEFLWTVGVHSLMLYAVVALMRAYKPRLVLEPLFFAASIVVLIGLYEFAAWYFGLGLLPGHDLNWLEIGGLRNPIPPQIYRLALTLGVSTNLSGYLALLIPVAVAWAMATENTQTRRMLVLWLVPALVVEGLTFSRGGLLSLGISLPLILIGALASSNAWRDRLLRLISDRRVQIMVIIGTLFVGALAIAWTAQDRSGHQAGDALRFDLWRSAWQIGLSDPVTGTGPGGFGRAVRSIRDASIAEDRFTSPHDIPLLIWSESGLPGVLAFGWVVFVGMTVLIRRWRDGSSDRDRMRVLGVGAALMGFGAQNIFDNLIMTPNLLPVIILAAYLIYPYENTQTPYPKLPQNAARLVLLGVLLSGVGWFLSDRAQWHFVQVVREVRAGDRDSALILIRKARQLDPHMGYYLAQEAQILAEMSFNDEAYLAPALDAYRDMLAIEGSYDVIHANYAQLLYLHGDWDQARSHLQTASDIYPRQPKYAMWHGVLAEEQGDLAEAKAAYLLTLDSAEHWLTSAFWDETDFRQEVRADWMAAHGLGDVKLAELSLISSACWPLLSSDSLEGEDVLCQGEIAFRIDNDLQSALASYEAAVQTLPPELVARAYLGRSEVYDALGMLGPARQDALTALFLGDRRASAVLGSIAEQGGNLEQAVAHYSAGGPIVVQFVGWDVAVYARRGRIVLLDVLDAPGPTRYDFAAWLALVNLYEDEGRTQDASAVRDQILALDPYFQFSAGQ